MPVYLLHGFRWSRDGLTGIRVRTILHDLEDVSADYIQNPPSQAGLLASLRQEYPDIMKNLPNIVFLEQYDPEDITSEAATCQPYAFVGDRVVTIAGGGPNNIQRPLSGVIQDGSKIPAGHGARKSDAGEERPKAMSPSPRSRDTALSVNVEDVMASGPGVSPAAWEALADLRDEIANGEKIGWFVVYNGDPERKIEPRDESEEDDNTIDGNTIGTRPSDEKNLSAANTESEKQRNMTPPATMLMREKEREKSLPQPPKEKQTSKADGLKKFFGKRERT
jgi:hypothetical protein